MPAPQISPLPTPPSRSQGPETFSTDADAFLGALPDFQAEANTQADYLDALAIAVDVDVATAEAAVVNAEAAASIAAGAANYQGDYSAGTTYQIGESVSYLGRRYVSKTVNTGVTPADGANWFLINDGDVLGPASATNNSLALFDGSTGKLIKSPLDNGTSGQVLASGGAGNAPVWQSPDVGTNLNFVASGSLGNGVTVILNADGTVSQVSGSIIGAGSNIAQPTLAAAYHEAEQKLIVFYRSGTNGAAKVGTISGKTITFGAEQIWEASAVNGTYMHACYATSTGTPSVFLVYKSTSLTTTLRVRSCTLSGGILTFSSATSWATGTSTTRNFAIANNPTAHYVMGIFYSDTAINVRRIGLNGLISLGATTNAIYAGTGGGTKTASICYMGSNGTTSMMTAYCKSVNTYGYVRPVVYTVATDTFSNETELLVESGYADFLDISLATSVNRIMFAHTWTSCMMSLINPVSSPTLISQVSVGVDRPYNPRVTWDQAAGKGIYSYSNTGQGNRLFASILTVTTASITFNFNQQISTYADQNVTSATDTTGKTWVGTPTGGVILDAIRITNLTSANFIGFSSASYTNGQTAKIQMLGSVNSSQSSLTINSKYYVWADGTIRLTAEPNVGYDTIAGTAIAATTILIKG